MFKGIVTLKNGAHKIVRMTIDKVAQFAAAMKQLREMPWLTKRYEDFFNSLEIDSKQILSCRFFNERTGEELINLA